MQTRFKSRFGFGIIKFVFACFAGLLVALSFFLGGCFLTQSSYDWAVETIENNYVGGEFDKNMAEEKTPAALAKLLDQYSAYYTKEEYDEIVKSNSGEFYGIGVTLSMVEGAGAMVVTVSGNSPALEAGLEPGDIITGGEVDGVKVTFENYTQLSEFIDARAKSEQFILSTAEKDYTLSRESFTQSYVSMSTNSTGWEFRSSAGGRLAMYENIERSMDFLPDGAAYVRLSQFYGDAANEFGKVVEKFNASSMNTLILDLRNNGGGYVNVMQSIGGYFVKSASKVAMTAKFKNGRTQNFKCSNHTKKIGENAEVYILMNSGTASASEALAGVLIDYGISSFGNVFISDYTEEYLATLGEGAKTGRSYGKGIMQSIYTNYSTHEVLKLTNAKIYWPKGKCIHDVGLTQADGCNLVKTNCVVTKGDKELRDVVEIIKSRTA